MMVTLKDISLACGVSISTVSKALGDYPDIGEETRQRVLTTAEKMGYITQRMESNAARRHTFTIGLLVTGEEETAFHSRVITQIRKRLSQKGYDLVILSPVSAGKGGEERPGYMFRARSMGMEGVFVFTQVSERSLFCRGEMQNLRDLILGNIPVVGVDCSLAACGCVVPDYGRGICGLINALYVEGRRRIAFVYGNHTGAGDLFEKDFIMALRERNMPVSQRCLCRVRDGSSGEAYARTRELLQAEKGLRPDGVLYSDDLLLQGGTEAIRDCGLQIPRDMAVAALRFTEVTGAQVCHQNPVISWRLSPEKIAEESVSMMLSEIHRAGRGSGQVCVVNGSFSYDNCENPKDNTHEKVTKTGGRGKFKNVQYKKHFSHQTSPAIV